MEICRCIPGTTISNDLGEHLAYNTSDQSQLNWEVIPTTEGEKEPSSNVIWDVLEADDETFIPESQTESKSVVDPPSNLEEAEALLKIIPLQSSDFEPVLNISQVFQLHQC